MKSWLRHGSRSPSLSSSGDWQEDEQSMSSKYSFSHNSITENGSNSGGVLLHHQEPVISLVECQNNLAESVQDSTSNGACGPSSGGGGTGRRQYSAEYKDYEPEDGKDDKKSYHHNNNHYRYNNQQNCSTGFYGQQYGNNNNGRRNNLYNHRQYGNNNGYGGGYNNQRRQYTNNNNFNNYNGFRNYRNNRRQFQPHTDYYHHHHHNNNHQYHNNYPHDSTNNGYYPRGGTRGFSDFYTNSYRRNNNSGAGTPLSSPEFEEFLPWAPKRGCAPLETGTFYTGGNYCNSNSRNCSPDNSPTSDISGGFPVTGQTRDIVLNNGSIITAQNLGPYDYLVGNQQQSISNNNSGFPYSPYTGNYLYGCTSISTASACERESASNKSIMVTQVMGPPPPPPSVSTTSSRAASRTDSPAAETATDWPDDSTDGSDSEGAGTSLSTRSQSPEEYTDLTLSNDASFRFYDNFGVIGKDFSPTTFCLGLPKGRFPHVSFPREWFEDLEPDEIIQQFSKVVDPKEKPFNVIVESTFTALDVAIWTKFVENQQTMETFRKKVELWRDVYRLVRFMNFTPEFKYDARNFPFFGLQVVGSTMSGFGSNASDVDMCLVIRDTEVDQRYEAVERLQALSQTLSSLPFVENVEMIYAKVPILKFRDSNRRLDVDLNCNNFVGIRNTHLLYAYAQMDWRLKPLVLIVKLWAQFHGINDAKMMTISSYSLVLMVIHFLQHGLDEPVLPNLQKEYPEKFSNSTSILLIKIHEEMPTWKSKNEMGLGELLILFLEYYSRKFDYTRNVISVRVGGTITMRQAANHKSNKNDFHSWKLLCVEEPFDRTNTARSVYDRLIFERIIVIFYVSWQRLLVTRLLDSIFTPFPEEEIRSVVSIVAARLLR